MVSNENRRQQRLSKLAHFIVKYTLTCVIIDQIDAIVLNRSHAATFSYIDLLVMRARL